MTRQATSISAEQDAFWKDSDHIEYHTRQFETRYRSTVHLAEFIKSLANRPGGEALDVACGAGANIYHLSQLVTGYRWTGIDIAGAVLYPIGRKYFDRIGLNPALIQGDMYQIDRILAGKRFDLVLSLQTILAIPKYEAAVEQMISVTDGWLFISSLFTDFDVDARITAVDHTRNIEGEPFYYNVYSLEQFRSFCLARGVKKFVAVDFEIDIDIEPPARGGLNSYTMRLEDGRRLQFTGPIYLPWKFIGMCTKEQ